MAARTVCCSAVIVGTSIGTSVKREAIGTTLASRNFAGLEMMPSLRQSSFGM
uniref:Uncharacterized protein n=1 Tax=Physcomitrium patens TaxID=3218 RepID=A0A2K1KPY2_PHYPA|nr:hypothetical protein PHYPA_006736 [Physcomitrium patens]